MSSSRAAALTARDVVDRPLNVLIRGDGVAALCCARLLLAAGVRVSLERVVRPRVPAIMLSRSAVGLIEDVFGRSEILREGWPIRRRIVRWGGEDAAALPHAGVVLSEARLIEALSTELPAPDATPADIVVHTVERPSSAAPRRFGAQRGSAASVRLLDAAAPDACAVEAVASGWLFLVPTGGDDAWLLGIGAPLADLLDESRTVAGMVDVLQVGSGDFDTTPRIAVPPRGDDWLAVGSAGIAFDPICGDGTAHAIRAAILAAAGIVAIAEGGGRSDLLAYYENMLFATMRRHLALCGDFYRSGGESAWWRAQLDAITDGHEWCTRRLTGAPPRAYRLAGFRLERLDAAA